jgi:hypothetical protein
MLHADKTAKKVAVSKQDSISVTLYVRDANLPYRLLCYFHAPK